MTAFRYSGCRHPVDPLRRVRDGQQLVCPQCGELRTVREVESVRGLVPRQPTGVTPEQPKGGGQLGADFTRRIIDAAGKGQVALLVTDAAGVVIVGVKGTGGLTKLKLDDEGRLLFEGALAGKPTVLDGSYALRNQLGADRTPERYEPEWPPPGHDEPRVQVPLPELEPGHVPMPEPHAFEGVEWGVADRGCTREGCGLPDRHPIHRLLDLRHHTTEPTGPPLVIEGWGRHPAPPEGRPLPKREPGEALAEAEERWGPT